MHHLYQKANPLTESVIGAAIEVHRTMGPGLIESIYEWCLEQEMTLRCIPVERQRTVTVRYKNLTREEPLRFDLLAANCLLVEVKATERILPIHKAQLLSYMKLLDVPIGLLMNFHAPKLADGTCRMILNGADEEPSTGKPEFTDPI